MEDLSPVQQIEGHVVSPDEEVESAYRTLQKYGKVPKRGDSFDIGESGGAEVAGAGLGAGSLLALFSGNNTPDIMRTFGLNQKQAENLRSLVVGAGTGGIHRLLSEYFGDEISGAIGGLLSGYIAKRVIKR